MERLWMTEMVAMETLPAQSVPALVRWDTMERKRQTAELLAKPGESKHCNQSDTCQPSLPLCIVLAD